jgi:hypothetical protein
MACSPNDYLRILGLVDSNIPMHFYFADGTHLRGIVARAVLDPVSRSGFMLLVVPDQSRIVQTDAGDIIKVSSRAPDGSLH